MKYFLWLSLAVFIVLITSCGGKQLKDDTVIPATQANKPTAEFDACGKKWVGLGLCIIDKGSELKHLNISVQGFYQGTIRVVSSTCEIDDQFRYDGSDTIKYEITGIAQKSCLISFVVLPEYPDEKEHPVVIHSFKGHLWLSVKDKEDAELGFISQSRQGFDQKISISVENELTGKIQGVIKGCDAEISTEFEIKDEKIEVPLSSLININEIKRCIFYGAFRLNNRILYFNWITWTYSERFLLLPVPVIKFSANKVEINADNAVSVVALDKSFDITNKATFEFDPSREHTLRLLTTGGRLLLGIWNPTKKGFEWMQ